MCVYVCADCVTSSYIPVGPFGGCELAPPTVEVEEFLQESPRFCQPFRVYRNHVYVYPRHLKYDSQRSFAKVPRSQRRHGNAHTVSPR